MIVALLAGGIGGGLLLDSYLTFYICVVLANVLGWFVPWPDKEPQSGDGKR